MLRQAAAAGSGGGVACPGALGMASCSRRPVLHPGACHQRQAALVVLTSRQCAGPCAGTSAPTACLVARCGGRLGAGSGGPAARRQHPRCAPPTPFAATGGGDGDNPTSSGTPQQPSSPVTPGDGSANRADEGATASKSASGKAPGGNAPRPRQPASPTWRTPWTWVTRLVGEPKAQLPLRILFNVFVLWCLMRLWPGRPGMGSDAVGDPLVVTSVPFSEVRLCCVLRGGRAGAGIRIGAMYYVCLRRGPARCGAAPTCVASHFAPKSDGICWRLQHMPCCLSLSLGCPGADRPRAVPCQAFGCT